MNPFADLLAAQKAFFASHATIPLDFRIAQLKKLKGAILNHQNDIEQALAADLGKDPTEAYMSEIGMTLSGIDWQIRHLKSLAAPHYHCTPLHQFPAVSKTIFIPYGSVLILAPWNYPFLLAMLPAAEAMAAGNTVVIKTGHAALATSAIMEQIIEETFDPEYAACIPGGRENITPLLDLDFDSFFFTGGKKLGQLVMSKAAEHVRPVSLELGGKSPAVVDETANLPLATKRIVFGKFLNAGQTCVAPDYVLVHESVVEQLVPLLVREIEKQYPNPASIGKIIDKKHYDHLLTLVDSAKVVCGGRASDPTLQIEPTVLFPASWEDACMQEEIFGPILPVLVYSDFRQLMDLLAAKETPLAFYLFTRDKLHENWMQRVQPFGGGCINDTIVQLSSDNLPFGGMGASGIGKYHGRWGFETFSHEKSVLIKSEWLDLPMRYANRKPWMARIIRKVVK